MAPLIILLSVFIAAWLVDRFLLRSKLGVNYAGRIAMAAMLLVIGITHFTHTAEMASMMPEAMPAKTALVYFTGICELLAVIGLLWDRTLKVTSVLLIIFFIAVLPANIAGALNQTGLGGSEYGPVYLFFRVPLQIFFIFWVWFFGIRAKTGGD